MFKPFDSTLETINQCPVCGSSQFIPFLTCTDYLVSKQKFEVKQCQTCTFRLTNPRPDADQLNNFYQSDQYISHNDKGNGLVNSIYRLVRGYTLQQKLKLINKLHGKAGKILDVGCGTGAFLETCQQGGWQVMGMEPDADARSIAEQKVGAVVQATVDDIKTTDPFDLITLWHVLEHIPTLSRTIQTLHSLLSTKGTLIIAVPNSNSYDADYYKEYWAAYDVPRHLYHFTPKTIKPLFSKFGFVLTEQKPMLFDAFYIAMLSSRYRTGATQYIESLRIGLQSNAYARKTGQASSMIYIFNKQ